jgi:Ca2+-binding RTX toxin-like protein
MSIVSGTNSNDYLVGTAGTDLISGGNGSDSILGGGGGDILSGGNGNDVVDGGAGNDVIDGGNGNDVLSGGSDADIINGGNGNDVLTGDAGADILSGGNGNDTLDGGAGIDLVLAGAGDDIVIHNAAENEDTANQYDGGQGTDTLHLVVSATLYNSAAFQAELESFNQAIAQGLVFYFSTLDILVQSFEQIEIVVEGDENQAPTDITLSNATIAENAPEATIVGTLDAEDADAGETFTFALLDNAGDLFAIDGSTLVLAGELDFETAGSHQVTIRVTDSGGAFYDKSFTIDVGDVTENDAVILADGGATLDFVFDGGSGNNYDTVVGGTGFDTLSVTYGGAEITQITSDGLSPNGQLLIDFDNDGQIDLTVSGVEELVVNGRHVIVFGDLSHTGLSAETIVFNGDEDDDTFDASGMTSTETVNAFGYGGEDTLTGAGGNDLLDGGPGNDELIGLGGRDILIGGEGADVLNGGNSSAVPDFDAADYRYATAGVTADLVFPENNTGEAFGDTYISIERLNGSDHNDSLYGDDIATNSNLLEGRGGGDYLDGRGGFDLAVYSNASEGPSPGVGLTVSLADPTQNTGEADGDTFVSIEGLIGSDFNDVLIGDGGNNFLIGAVGADELIGGAGQDTADYRNLRTTASLGVVADLSNPVLNEGDAEGDTYDSIENLRGTNFNDTLRGDAGNNFIAGLAGADILDGGMGFDTAGYNGPDVTTGVTADLSDSANNTGDAFGDTYFSIEGLQGTLFNDTLVGDANTNSLVGFAGDDTILGGDGRDFLVGGPGNDNLDGGGNGVGLGDLVNYSSSPSAVSINLGTGSAADGFGFTDSLQSIEQVFGSPFGDTLIGSSIGNEVFNGHAGNDYVDGGGGSDFIDYVDFSIVGVNVNLAQNTAADGFGDTDSLFNIDNVNASRFDDTVTGNAGDNRLRGFDGSDTIYGGDGNDQIEGDQVTQTSVINFGDDMLFGEAGNDTLHGQAGDDTLDGGEDADTLDGGDDRDTASYRNALAGLIADLNNSANNTGEAVGDTYVSIESLEGSEFEDVLRGDAAENFIQGLDGNDTLQGGEGNDTLAGGDGRDTAVYIDASEAIHVVLTSGTVSGTGVGTDALVEIEGVQGTIFNDTYDATGFVGVTNSPGIPAGINTFEGMAGDDLIIGNIALGGLALTRIDYINATAGVTVDIAAGTAFVTTIERVSVSSSGLQANNESDTPSISADGYVAFASTASNLVPGDNNAGKDIFVHDRSTHSIQRLAVGETPTISADGRYVAFRISDEASPILNDTNDSLDIFVYDRQTDLVERVSVGAGGVQANNDSQHAVFSFDGRYVAFNSAATNLVSNDTNNSADIFVYDRDTDTIERVSIATNATEGNNHSLLPSISADGRYVAFSSFSSNLVANDTNGAADVFVYDRDTDTVERVSVATDASEGNNDSQGNNHRQPPSISADGRYVAFISGASNLTADDTNGHDDVFVYDRDTDTIERVSIGVGSVEANGESDAVAISGDGRHVAFQSAASNLVADDTNESLDIFIYDRDTDTIKRVSNGDNTDNGGTLSISADGTYIAFSSPATNLVPNDSNGSQDIFVANVPAINDLSVGTDTFSGVFSVLGSSFEDTILGSNNAIFTVEIFDARGGDDFIDGRGGSDRAAYNTDPETESGIHVNLAAGIVIGDSSIGTDTLRSMEGVRGTQFADIFDATGFGSLSINAGSQGTNNNFEGMGGDDEIIGNGTTNIFFGFATSGVIVDIASETASGDDSVGTDHFTGVNSVSGSFFDDVLRGSDNAAGTTEFFVGFAGDDEIDGRGGFDQVSYNIVNFTTDGIVVNLGAGTVTGDASVGIDELIGIEAIQGTSFVDTYDATGVGGFNRFEGMGDNDFITGSGNTQIGFFNATAGVTVDLDAGTASGDTSVGNDVILAGVNSVLGSNFADSLAGDANNNTLLGQSGNDTIEGREGNDTLSGGGGNDNFVFSDGDGADVITDFLAGPGIGDVIDLSGVSSVTNFDDVLALAADNGVNTVIDFGGGDVVTINNVLVSMLNSNDFSF